MLHARELQSRRRLVCTCALAGALVSQGVFPATVEYTLSNLGANRFEVDYTVTNDLAADIEQFSIFFDVFSYENLLLTTPLAGWDELVLEPALTPPFVQDGLYDALTLGAGITPGASLSGFSLSFDWLGSGTPGTQDFEIIDPSTFQVLDSGQTQSASGPPTNAVAVPATSSVSILLAALFVTAAAWSQNFLSRRRHLEAGAKYA